MPLQDLEHGWLEVIVDDHLWDPSPELKGMALAEQKGLLPLRGEAFDKHRPTKTEPSSQEGNLDQLAFDLHCGLAKVKFCSLAWSKVERNKSGFGGVLVLLHVHTDRRFANRDLQLAEFHPHAMGGPALFGRPTREPLILLEPLFNMRKSGITHWRLLPSLALIATFLRGWLLQKQFGHGITREPKVLGSCALTFALDQHPGANFVSKCHGIHLSFPPLA
jgi:hypothetical protein